MQKRSFDGEIAVSLRSNAHSAKTTSIIVKRRLAKRKKQEEKEVLVINPLPPSCAAIMYRKVGNFARERQQHALFVSFFVSPSSSPFARERTPAAGCARQTFPLISWSRTRVCRRRSFREERNAKRTRRTAAVNHIRRAAANPEISPFRSDVRKFAILT